MTEDVRRLAEQIKARFPDRVNPPITAENEATLKSLGVDIAPEALDLLRVFDGTTQDILEYLYFPASIGPPDQPTVGWYIELLIGRLDEPAFEDGDSRGWSNAVRPVMFSRGWTPIVSTMDGDTWFVDHDPAPEGVDGQVFLMNIAEGGDCVEVVAPSVVAMLEKLLAG